MRKFLTTKEKAQAKIRRLSIEGDLASLKKAVTDYREKYGTNHVSNDCSFLDIALDIGDTALILATAHKKAENVRYLLQQGAAKVVRPGP